LSIPPVLTQPLGLLPEAAPGWRWDVDIWTDNVPHTRPSHLPFTVGPIGGVVIQPSPDPADAPTVPLVESKHEPEARRGPRDHPDRFGSDVFGTWFPKTVGVRLDEMVNPADYADVVDGSGAKSRKIVEVQVGSLVDYSDVEAVELWVGMTRVHHWLPEKTHAETVAKMNATTVVDISDTIDDVAAYSDIEYFGRNYVMLIVQFKPETFRHCEIGRIW
jgi:hypothetical protein